MHFGWPIVVMTAITSIQINFLRLKITQPLGLFYRPIEGMPVVRVAVQRLHADYEVIFRRGRHANFAAELVTFVRLAFGDTFHFRRVQAV